MKTYFAPPERVSNEEAFEHYQKLIINQSIINVIEAIPEVILILNKFRQIIFANNVFLELLNKKNLKEVIGLRPGEAVECIYSDINEAGCGTSKFCRFCGAVRAILDSINGEPSSEECKILTKDNKCLLIRVKTVPVEIDNIKYTLFTLRDIKDEKAMKEYQKLLFFDINEIISEILIATEVLKKDYPDDMYIENIHSIAENAVDILNKQKLLIAAENNEISIFPVSFFTNDFLKEFIKEKGNNKIFIEDDSENIEIETDLELLRIIFESIIFSVFNIEEDKIFFKSEDINNKVKIFIKSKKYLESEIQYNLFKKDLIDKKRGEELGTYLAKILTEWYLNGKIEYTSDPEKGTTFIIELPKRFIL